MAERGASTTAVAVAMMRAAHQLLDGLPRVLDDTVVVDLVGPSLVERIHEERARYGEPGAMAIRSHVLLRSRFAEERLRVAVERGVEQFVVLGAGLDTFAYRQPSWARTLQIFEVDHPASQAAKRGRLAAAAIAIPSNLTFAPIDFEHDTLAAGLTRAGFSAGKMTFVSCLGVLIYLTSDAIDAVFGFVAKLPPGSECAFTFGGARGEDRPGSPSIAARAAAAGEPWISSLELDDVVAVLERAGLSELVQPSGEQIALWLGDRTDGLQRPKRDRIASVVAR